MARSPRSSPAVCLTRYGRTLINAGNKVIENNHAAAIPTAVMLPRCQNGGESEKLSARKPMIVVIDVIPTGMKLSRIASMSASLFSMPERAALRSAIRMCIESAIAKVRIMVGAAPEIGVSLMPMKPAQPMPTMVDSMMTPIVAIVAVTERSTSSVSSRMTPNITGISVLMSEIPVSENALFSIDTPVIETSMSGWAASICVRRSRANSTASGTSVMLFSGYCSTTLTAVTAPSDVTSWFSSNGSAVATAPRRARSSALMSLELRNRSSTIRSSSIP